MSEADERLRIGGVVGEALTFAGRHLEDALRACWAPALLLLAWAAYGVPALSGLTADAASPSPVRAALPAASSALAALVPLILTATYMAPLILQAAGREELPHRTVPNVFWGAELRYVLGTIGSLSGLYLLAGAPIAAGVAGLGWLRRHVMTAEVATFEAGSLHASDLVPAYSEGVRAFVEGGHLGIPGGPGLPTGAPLIAAALAGLLVGYVWLRLFPLPGVLVAGSGGRGVLRATLAASRGWNLLRLLAAIGLVGAANLTLLWLLGLVPALVAGAVGVATPFLEGVSALASGGEVDPWVARSPRLVTQGVEVASVVVVTAIGAALNAGLYGAIVRRVGGDG